MLNECNNIQSNVVQIKNILVNIVQIKDKKKGNFRLRK